MMDTPQALGFRQPAEWMPHAACWLAWPSHPDLWEDFLAPTRQEFVDLCAAIAAGGERLEILVPDDENERLAIAALGHLPARFHRIPFGDIWMRDIAPIFTVRPQTEEVATLCFRWNGWGEKYLLPGDEAVAENVSKLLGLPAFRFPWVLEGGAVEVDGEGTCLTTRQCLLNPNRNLHLNQAQIETGLREALGVEKILWLEEGLLNDHTDGHIDTIARFVAPGKVVCMEARSACDPNADVLHAIGTALETMTDARDRRLEVIRVPSPGGVRDPEGNYMPASYLNFYIANQTVVVPTYHTPWDDEAVAAIAACFPDRRVVGCYANHILLGGGAFHCITQQQPMGAN